MGKRGGLSFLAGMLIRVLAVFTVLAAVVIGIGLGLSLAETANIMNQENFVEFAPALPTKILDINGRLITEFSADEKRELVSLSELPRHLIYAILSREDPDFYNHRGFSVKGIARAVVGQITKNSLGGGSTITQQIAGSLYTDRTEKTISRKIKELWWAFQMERRYTKNEILEIYLNYINMGPGTYGVEAASKYFFGHSAREVSLAESAILAILPSSPSRFNPVANPNDARDRQLFVLDRMIRFGYTSAEEAEASFIAYWNSYDYTRASTSAYYNREDAAPWFSEYVRRELSSMMYGTRDYYRDGYTVQTTLNLAHQQAAEKYMAGGITRANREFAATMRSRNVQAERTYIPIVELLALGFNLEGVHATSRSQNEQRALSQYTKVINPVVDMAALVFGIGDLKTITAVGFEGLKDNTEHNLVEGALIALENETGYITAIVGGSKYDESNQLIRATQARVQPGSSFKPLYYSAAIDSRKFNAASLIYDLPVVFHNEDGTPYIPQNFKGEWKGSVLLYDALAQSMNVPSIKVLDAIGFDAAIDRAAALLGITDPVVKRNTFPRVYPLGLGIASLAPIQMAKAFAAFANQGREVTPIAIRMVEDRNGRVILDPERELRLRQRRQGSDIQVISPQNAYIMTSMLKKTVEVGTLASAADYGAKFTFRDEKGTRYRIPAAGKTGTPQNWSDAWAIGYTPYYTTAVWFGFDKPGNSLGVNLTGATLSGPIWGDFMREIHQGLPMKDFVRPATGVVDVEVCAKSGLLKTAACNEGEVVLPFLEGTRPTQYCNIHGTNAAHGPGTGYDPTGVRTIGIDDRTLINGLRMPSLDLDLLPPVQTDLPARTTSPASSPAGNRNTTQTTQNVRNALSSIPSSVLPTDLQAPPTPVSVPEPLLPEAQLDAEVMPEPVSGFTEEGIELPAHNPLLD